MNVKNVVICLHHHSQLSVIMCTYLDVELYTSKSAERDLKKKWLGNWIGFG